MFLDDYHTVKDGRVRITADQASHFAKYISGDYNPIHNTDARRFCVPGDLLFALVLAYYGLSQCMTFHFRSMVGNDVPLIFEQPSDDVIVVADENGKHYLEVERQGETTRDPVVVEAFTRRYVSFSGKNFPHYLKPLMEDKGVMFNPQRPLVIYDSMGFALDRLDVTDPGLTLSTSSFEVSGKRGEVLLEFRMTAAGVAIGHGSKKLVVSGLQPYDANAMDAIVDEFYRLKAAYEATV
ncbi:DUF3581 family protein [Aidingimonas lacisalsi]|uniref:DUF3581 family protein n=1 Tax=Aidingimonas lacisalsi TaxID=2604086 RepID=UPI0011D1FD6B|nr:DUF3581 family protein [Aidingimonas lacisalsi]